MCRRAKPELRVCSGECQPEPGPRQMGSGSQAGSSRLAQDPKQPRVTGGSQPSRAWAVLNSPKPAWGHFVLLSPPQWVPKGAELSPSQNHLRQGRSQEPGSAVGCQTHPGQGKLERVGFVGWVTGNPTPEPGMSRHVSFGMLKSATSWDSRVLGTRGRALFSALQQTSARLPHLSAQIFLTPARKRGLREPKISFSPFFFCLALLELGGLWSNSHSSRPRSQLCPPWLRSQPLAKPGERGLPLPGPRSLGFTPLIKHPREIPAKLQLLPS